MNWKAGECMMDKVELRELSMDDGHEILEMLKEIGPGENGFINDAYEVSALEFKGYLAKKVDISRGIDPEPQWVPQTTYWLYADDQPIGYGKLRHYLNDNLRKIGGHIGYCIRPTARGKGYGNVILKEMLKKAKEKNIPRALLTCEETNDASRGVIEHNGGMLERIEDAECYYWIDLDIGTCIREIHIDEYSEVYNLWSATPGVGMNEADSRENLNKFLLKNKGMSFCCKKENRIVGTVLCGHDGRRGYIYHVTVAEGYRGRGIGSMLVDKSLQKLRKEGIGKCHLFVFNDNKVGNAFWSSIGWTKRDDLFIYSKSL